MTDVAISEADPVRSVLDDYFTWATTHVNRFEPSATDVPDDLQLPEWTWDGPVRGSRAGA